MVSQAWKSLKDDEREYWEDLARRDRARYDLEKEMYRGPWKIPVEMVAVTQRGRGASTAAVQQTADNARTSSPSSLLPPPVSSAVTESMSDDSGDRWDHQKSSKKRRCKAESATSSKSGFLSPVSVCRDPSAPRRPMSSFLAFSNSKRGRIRKLYPAMKNTEISQFLAKLWKNATHEEKQFYLDQHEAARLQYRKAVEEHKASNTSEELDAYKRKREEIALRIIDSGGSVHDLDPSLRDEMIQAEEAAATAIAEAAQAKVRKALEMRQQQQQDQQRQRKLSAQQAKPSESARSKSCAHPYGPVWDHAMQTWRVNPPSNSGSAQYDPEHEQPNPCAQNQPFGTAPIWHNGEWNYSSHCESFYGAGYVADASKPHAGATESTGFHRGHSSYYPPPYSAYQCSYPPNSKCDTKFIEYRTPCH
jgi:HMG (high mobility group) box